MNITRAELVRAMDAPRRHRVRLAFVVSTFLCALAVLQGCADEARRDLPPWVSTRAPATAPMHIRTLGPDRQFSELAADSVARRLPSDPAAEPLRILALSGGGAFGAFGAGALVGMSQAGERRDFTVVTGVSADALIAPYAFLGPAWDAELVDSYTSGSGEHLLRLRGLGAVFGSSLYQGAPLAKLIDHYVTDDLLRAVASEAAKGRLLLVATTNVDSGEPVIWDLGSIARYGGGNAHDLFRDVLLASASVPGMFPPVVMHFQKNGQSYDEAHVDGAVTLPFFVAPEFADVAQGSALLREASVFVLIDGSIDELPQATRLRTGAIVSRSVTSGMHMMMRTTLELVGTTAAAHGVRFEYAAVPAAYPQHKAFDFSAANMRPLFQYAASCAETAQLWTMWSPNSSPSLVGPDAAGVLPCPARDAAIERLARAAP
jgi:predicted acylesterase/phospholipase RssA